MKDGAEGSSATGNGGKDQIWPTPVGHGFLMNSILSTLLKKQASVSSSSFFLSP